MLRSFKLASTALALILTAAGAASAAQARAGVPELRVELRRLLDANLLSDALPVAQRIVDASDSLSIGEKIGAYGDLGGLRKELGDPDGAVLAYEEVIRLAKQSNSTGSFLGVVYDNLAMLRRAQGDWDAAEAASDHALEVFENTVGVRDTHYGAALNNRAVILGEQEKFVLALDYSERALNVLRDALQSDAKALEPFLQDNRWIRGQLRR